MKGIIDRFEENFAVVEFDEEMKSIERKLLPSDAKEGDVLVFDENKIFIDYEETKLRKKEIEKLMDELFE